MSTDNLSQNTFSLKFTLALSLIGNTIRMCRVIDHEIQYTKPVESVSEGCREPVPFCEFTVVVEMIRKRMANYPKVLIRIVQMHWF